MSITYKTYIVPHSTRRKYGDYPASASASTKSTSGGGGTGGGTVVGTTAYLTG